MLHKPRFYAPDYFGRDNWGYKRKCGDFIAKEKPGMAAKEGQ